ncbi:AI-2E family transporter [Demequina oxidasica]|uniref:AI-2E family transporter n=1 Tax=Demequina oxidasica TaxID=676199 RepID=UPI000784DA2E|nr:AI-2E family transporter [Demequina oxidasica]
MPQQTADNALEIKPSHRTRGEENITAGHVPMALRVTAAWSWRIVVIGIVAIALFTAFLRLSSLMVPLIVALLIAAPLERLVTKLARHGLPRGGGAALTILSGFLIIVALVALAGTSIVVGFDDLREAAVSGYETFIDWLSSGPLHLSGEQIDEGVQNLTGLLQDNALGVANSAFGITSAVGGVFAGTIIAMLALFFFLRDGRRMWVWSVNHMPVEDRHRVDLAGLNAWHTLARYTKTSAFVAFVDAVGIGIGAWIIGVPLALPIGILVFLFSFIPLFGATLSGVIAVFVALFTGGWKTALVMLAIVIVVQQVEGSVLYPWLFGKAASIHPMVILLTVSAGTLILGLVGAVVAVPLLAFTTAFVTGYRKDFDPEKEDPPISSTIPIIADKSRDAFRRARETISHTTEIRVRKNRRDIATGAHRDADAATPDDIANESDASAKGYKD